MDPEFSGGRSESRIDLGFAVSLKLGVCGCRPLVAIGYSILFSIM